VNSLANQVNDRPHEPFQDLLAAAAFGTLTDEEWASLREHLETCPDCRAELADFQVIAGALPVTLDDQEPPARLRNRILVLVQQEHRVNPEAPGADGAAGAAPTPAAPEPQPAPPPVPIRTPTPIRRRFLSVAAALALLSLLAGAAIGRYLLTDDPEPDSETIAMEFPTPIPNVTGELRYIPEEELFLLEMENMPPAPANQVYQVWMVSPSGPVPMAIMNNPDGEFALAADRSQFSELRITVEPGPNGSPAPTSDPVLIAPLSED
jgi:hypothetical protein